MECMSFTRVSVVCLSMMAIVGVYSRCEIDSGTEGITECLSSTAFPNRKYQAAVCMRRSTLKSVGILCKDPFAEYCWYYCSFTPNNPGFSVCECDPKKNPSALTSAVPLSCYTPDGKDCSWYRRCLETRIPCESTAHPYAITYAEKYCERYGNNYNKFSRNGRKWVDAVRKCLQESLVHVMFPQINISCENVKERAVSTHTRCYLKPSNEIGLRDLSIGDCLWIFWTVKGAFVDEFFDTLHGSWSVIKQCLANLYPHNAVKHLELFIRNAASNTCDEMATSVAKRLARIQKWSSDIMYYSYCPKHSASQLEPIPINIMISDKTGDEANVNRVINAIQESASDGSLKTLTLEDGHIIEIEKITDCIDPECKSSSFVVETGCSKEVKSIACKIKNTRKIILLTRNPSDVNEENLDGADPYSNIRDACDGRPSKRSEYTCDEGKSPGGVVCLKASILNFIYNLGTSTNYTFQVNAIAGACHTSTSKHYLGQAVDLQLDRVPGGRNTSQEESFMDACRVAGGSTHGGSHVHCQIVGDDPCIDERGTCQENNLLCNGQYQSGLCGGGITRQCCLPAPEETA